MPRFGQTLLVNLDPREMQIVSTALEPLAIHRLHLFDQIPEAWNHLHAVRNKNSVRLVVLNVRDLSLAEDFVAGIMTCAELSHIRILIVGIRDPAACIALLQRGAFQVLRLPLEVEAFRATVRRIIGARVNA